MYQNIYIEYQKDRDPIVHLWDDKHGYNTFPFSRYGYVLDPTGPLTTFDGKKVKKDRFVKKDDPNAYEHDLPIETRVLIDIYGNDDNISENHNLVFFDIECEIGGELTPEYIRSAPMKITSIAFYEKTLDQYTILTLDPKHKINIPSTDKLLIYPCLDEKQLLYKFLELWENANPSIISGWNSEYFDIPYLYNRLKNQLGVKEANRLSPTGNVHFDQYNSRYQIAGVSALDYILLYKKFTMDEPPSYKLDDIGELEVGIKKIEFEGNLDDLYNKDVNRYIEYNIRDVEILVELDNKLKFINLAQNLAHKGKVPYEAVYQSSRIHEGAIISYLNENKIIGPRRPLNPIIKKNYAGGYLKDPVPGVYPWLYDLDLASLYPSIIMSLNVGIETLFARIVLSDDRDNHWGFGDLKKKDPNLVVTLENKDRKTIDITIKDLIQLIETNNLSISANGTMFRTDKQSVLSVILNKWFKERQEYKAKMKQAYKSGDAKLGEFYHMRQWTMKILLNSLYGALALKGFRFGSIMLSEAITLTGQRIIQESFGFVNREYGKELGEEKDYCVYSDTDSAYLMALPIIEKRFGDISSKNEEEIINLVESVALEFEEKVNDFYGEMSRDLFNITSHRFEMKTECVLKSSYFSGKRRYAQNIVKQEGVSTNKFDIKGLDIKKSNFPKAYSKFMIDVLKKIMNGYTKDQIDNELLNFYENMKNLDLVTIAKPTNVKDLKKYVSALPNPGEIFSSIEKGAPAHVKAAIVYNDYLRLKKLNKNYQLIKNGDKIKWVYLKNNPLKMEAIAFKGYDDPAEVKEFIKEYTDYQKMFETITENKLQTFYDDLNWGQINKNPYSNQFFSFV